VVIVWQGTVVIVKQEYCGEENRGTVVIVEQGTVVIVEQRYCGDSRAGYCGDSRAGVLW